MPNQPQTWSEARLKEIADTATGGTPSRKNSTYFVGSIPWVKSGELNDGVVESTEEHINSNAISDSSAKLFPKGTLLIALYGATAGKTGILAMEAATNQAVAAIFPRDPKQFDRDFIKYYLMYLRPHLLDQRHGGAQPNISQTILRDLIVRYPLYAEQKQIAVVLRNIQERIEEQRNALSVSKELRTALLHRLFGVGLSDEGQRITSIGPVPKSWKETTLEKTGDVIYGIQAAVANNLEPIGTKILTNKNISIDGGIVLDEINYFELKTQRHKETILQKGDLLFNWRSGSKEHVGKTAFFDLDGEFVHSSFILRIRAKDRVLARYLFYYLNYLRESGFFVRSQTFSINAKFNKSAVNQIPVYLPNTNSELERIVDVLDLATQKFSLVDAKRDLLEQLFDTCLHGFMTGHLSFNEDQSVTQKDDSNPLLLSGV